VVRGPPVWYGLVITIKQAVARNVTLYAFSQLTKVPNHSFLQHSSSFSQTSYTSTHGQSRWRQQALLKPPLFTNLTVVISQKTWLHLNNAVTIQISQKKKRRLLQMRCDRRQLKVFNISNRNRNNEGGGIIMKAAMLIKKPWRQMVLHI